MDPAEQKHSLTLHLIKEKKTLGKLVFEET